MLKEELVKKQKIIIDTDIGDDIDDLLAISLALNSPELDIIGITTVFKNTKLRAKMTSKVLRLAGRTDVKVIPGIGRPLMNNSAKPYIDLIDTSDVPCQYTKDMDKEELNDGNAVDFIIEKIMQSDNDIIIVPIGPLTNIALAISKQPAIINKIQKIVLMGGAYSFHSNEYNILCDPEAAAIVFDSGVPLIAVGLDVTLKCRLTQKDIDEIKKDATPLGEVLYHSITLWKGDTENLPYLHDPLAIGVIIDESFARYKKVKVSVETKGERTRGMTFNESDNIWWENKEPNKGITICTDVDKDRFVKFFMNRII